MDFERIFETTFLRAAQNRNTQTITVTVMTFGNECNSLQMAIYCKTFEGTKNAWVNIMLRI